MLLKTKLFIVAGLLSIVAVTMCIVIMVNAQHAKQASREYVAILKVQTTLSALDKVTYEYLLHREKRMVQQWNSLYLSIPFHIKSLRETSRNTSRLLSINSDYGQLLDGFEKLTKNYAARVKLQLGHADRKKIENSLALDNLLISRLLLLSQSITTNVSKLAADSLDVTTESHESFRRLIIVFTLFFVFIVSLTVLVIGNNLAKPIKGLMKGTAEIGKGNLQYQIKIHNKDELGQLAQAFNDMGVSLLEAQGKAKQALLAKSEFLASMSHEIRTPMNGVIGMLSLLADNGLNDDQFRQVTIARSSAESLLTLINDILDFSKIEAGKLDIEAVDFDLSKMLAEFIEAMRFSVKEKTLDLKLDTANVSIPWVQGDPHRLRQILTNLVGNAIKFTEHGYVSLSVSTKVSPHESSQWILECEICDTGIGIPEDKLPQLFDSFSQVDASTTRHFGGTGLGLTIAKKLCELMGGTITATSEFGKGSCFTFDIVLGHATTSTSHVEGQVRKVDDHPKWPANTRILLVEDNPVNQIVARGLLKKLGLSVDLAGDGVQALEILNTVDVPYTLLLTDCQMPNMDGYETSRQIRAGGGGEQHKAVPIVAMTANAMSGDREKCLDAGMDDYLAKPIVPHALSATLQEWLLPD